MESIKLFFQNALIGLATLILISLQTDRPTERIGATDNSEDDNDVHLFI